MAGEVASLVTGINGGTALSVFSSNLPGSFAAPRTVSATAVLLAEPPIPFISRQSGPSGNMDHHASCPRPIIDVGGKINAAQTKLTPVLNRFSKLIALITNVQSKISSLQSRAFQKLGIACLFPKLLRPFNPLIERVKCKLGLNDDGFMETPPCNTTACLNPIIEDRQITRDLGLENLDFMVEDTVSTMDQCFEDMDEVTYGSRVIAKLVDDQSCEDPRYESLCEQAMAEDRIIDELDCQTPG